MEEIVGETGTLCKALWRKVIGIPLGRDRLNSDASLRNQVSKIRVDKTQRQTQVFA